MLEISLGLCQQMCNNILSVLGWLSVGLLFLLLLFLLWAFRVTVSLRLDRLSCLGLTETSWGRSGSGDSAGLGFIFHSDLWFVDALDRLDGPFWFPAQTY